MLKGILYALAASLIGGVIFVLPPFMKDFSALEITLGGFFFYGLVSLICFCKNKIQKKITYSSVVWKKAFSYSLVTTIIYYSCIIVAVRNAAPAACALILGISPVTIAFYGNLRKKERSFRSLLFPSLLILIGLIMINVPQITHSHSTINYMLGLLCCFIALIGWSWFFVSNSSFLKKHPTLSSSEWSTLIGVATFFWVAFSSLFILIFFKEAIQFDMFSVWGKKSTNFVLCCAILGLVSSWMGTWLWNKASCLLPVSLTGQLTILETIFGLCFVYAVEKRYPPTTECLGIMLFLGAVVYGLKISSQLRLKAYEETFSLNKIPTPTQVE